MNASVDGGLDGLSGSPEGAENGNAGDVLDLSALSAPQTVIYGANPETGTVNGLDADLGTDISFAEIERVLRENELLITEWAPIHLHNALKAWFWKDGTGEANALNVWQQTCQQCLWLSGLSATRRPRRAASASAALTALMNGIVQTFLLESPETLTSLGMDRGPKADARFKLSDRSQAKIDADKVQFNDGMKAVKAIDKAQLTATEQTYYDSLAFVGDNAFGQCSPPSFGNPRGIAAGAVKG